jgi:hypothetical protein
MGRPCRLTLDGSTVAATWTLGPAALLLTPVGSPPRSILLRDIAGIGGDDTCIELILESQRVILSRLGASASALRTELTAAWLPVRAAALRLADAGELLRFSGQVATPSQPPTACVAALARRAVLLAPASGDVAPLFLAEVAGVEFDAERWAVPVRRWGGDCITFSKLGNRTEEILRALQAARGTLAQEAEATLARFLPTVAAAERCLLAGHWLPGRFLSLPELDALAPGAATALFASWVAAQPRRQQGEALRQWAAGGTLWAGYRVEGTTAELWLLARRGERFLLESISQADWATYRFAGGDELPTLAGHVLSAPQFSREALYLPLEQLTGERAAYAVAARALPFLQELRARFRGRIVHTEPTAWRAALDSA